MADNAQGVKNEAEGKDTITIRVKDQTGEETYFKVSMRRTMLMLALKGMLRGAGDRGVVFARGVLLHRHINRSS